MHIACPWWNLAILTNNHISLSLISAVSKKIWRCFISTLAECQRTNMCINTSFPLPRTRFPSSAHWQLLFPHPVPSCFSAVCKFFMHATQVECLQSVLTVSMFICCTNTHLRRKHPSEHCAGFRLLARANCGNLWKEVTDARHFIIYSQLSSACSAVPGTAPPRQAGYVTDLFGIGGV